jgi:hypothetical protein
MKTIVQVSVLMLFLAVRTIHSQAEGDLFIFTANVSDERTIKLNWETKNENNSYKFNVERKTSMTNWETISSVKASVLSNSPKHYSFEDQKLQSDSYQYRIRIINNDSTFEYSKIVESKIILPNDFELSQNYPNPFNPSTKINYTLPFDSNVILEVFNIEGVKITQLVNEEKSAGYYSVDFNSNSINRSISSGVYFYRIIASNKVGGASFSLVKKMNLIK